MQTTARIPWIFAASATPCAWLPADEQTTPRRFCSSGMSANLFSGPRILYDPTRWNISALRRTSNPVRSLNCREVSSGVCLMCGAMRARTSSKSRRVRVNMAMILGHARRWYRLQMLAILLAVAAAAASPQAFVQKFAATYMKQHRMYGLLEGKDRRAMAPFLTSRLLHQLDDASACQRDWRRQQPKGSTDKPPYVDCCLFFGIADGNPTSIRVGAAEALADGRTKVVVNCEQKAGRDDIHWRDAVIV